MILLRQSARQAADDAMKQIKKQLVHKFLDTAVSDGEISAYADNASRDLDRSESYLGNERSGLLNLIEHLDPVPLPEEIIAATTVVRIKPVLRPVQQVQI